MNSLSIGVMVAGAVLGALVVTQIWLLARLTRILGPVAHLEERMSRFAEALSLLTETTETGFRAVADELGRRRDEVPNFLQSRAASSRVAAAARRGRSIPEIAAAEDVSEGEVRLRLHLGGQNAPKAKEAAPRAAKPANKTIAMAKPAAAPAPRQRRARTEIVDDLRA